MSKKNDNCLSRQIHIDQDKLNVLLVVYVAFWIDVIQ